AGTYRDADHQILAAAPGTVLTHATLAILRRITGLEAEIHQSIEGAVAEQIDTAPVAAIATVGSAFGNEFFSTEAHAAIAALARFHGNLGFINELHVFPAIWPYEKSPVTGRGF